MAPDTTGDGTGCDNMTCIIVQFKQDWLTKRHSSKDSFPDIKQETSAIDDKINSDSVNVKGDFLSENSKTLLDHSSEIKEANKRSLAAADETAACLNGDSLPTKKVKLDEGE